VFYGTKDHNSLNLLCLGSASPVDDLFSLGSTLLELQMGSLPWSEDPEDAANPADAAAEGADGGGPFGPRALAAAARLRKASWGLAVRLVIDWSVAGCASCKHQRGFEARSGTCSRFGTCRCACTRVVALKTGLQCVISM
jgi:hypothetical protein